MNWNLINQNTSSDLLLNCNNGTKPDYISQTYNNVTRYVKSYTNNNEYYQTNNTKPYKFKNNLLIYSQNYTSMDTTFYSYFYMLENGIYRLRSSVCNVFGVCVYTELREIIFNYIQNISLTQIYPQNNSNIFLNPIKFIISVNGGAKSNLNVEFRKEDVYGLNYSCHQKSAVVVNQNSNDGNCSLNYSGSNSGGSANCVGGFDGNWGTRAFIGASCYNYPKKPLNTIGLIWNYSIGTPVFGIFNYQTQLPNDCFTHSPISLLISNGVAYCSNSTGYKVINDKSVETHSGTLYEDALDWIISDIIDGELLSNVSNQNILFDNQYVYSDYINVNTGNPFCWYSKAYNGSDFFYSSTSCFYFGGTCFDNIKNQDEIATDYGGVCGQCGNYSIIYQDSIFTIIKESGLYSIPFNESQCQDGNAVSGAYLLLILITFLVLLIFIIVLFIFGIVPLIIFIFFGRFWFPFFSRRKKKKSEK